MNAQPLKLFCAFAIAALLIGCNAQSGTGTMPQRAIQARKMAGSWMLPEAKGEDLIYVTDGYANIRVYSYSSKKVVGNITGIAGPQYECSDKNGNIFVTGFYPSTSTYEFRHAGTTPVATFETTYPIGCAWDPTTDNLAICGGTVNIFTSEQGEPTTYVPPNGSLFCTYDSQGNLFLTTNYENHVVLLELQKGSGSFVTVPLNQDWYPGSLQWDGKYLALNVPTGSGRGYATIYRISVVGSSAKIVGKTFLYSEDGNHNDKVNAQFWIQGRAILGGQKPESSLAAWQYPRGGKPRRSFHPSGDAVIGVTVSVAPTRR